ncbi:MAG: hypothetical protein ABL986_10680 [Vicinamibacterales bacterium]
MVDGCGPGGVDGVRHASATWAPHFVARLTGLSVVPSNVVAVATASIATFLVSDRLVFRQ